MGNLLFIFEGESTEFKILKSLQQFFFNEADNIVVQTAYCNDIYDLYKKVNEDNFLDTFQLIKSIPHNKSILADFKRSDFAEIYLFFDFDYHDNVANTSNLNELLDFFNEETESGKLYISYPMVEALRHYQSDIDFKDLAIHIDQSKNYKSIVGDKTEKKYINLHKFSREIWAFLIIQHVKKMNYIVTGSFQLPSEYVEQASILKSQREKYVEPDNLISVLSGFPIAILDYYGLRLIQSFK